MTNALDDNPATVAKAPLTTRPAFPWTSPLDVKEAVVVVPPLIIIPDVLFMTALDVIPDTVASDPCTIRPALFFTRPEAVMAAAVDVPATERPEPMVATAPNIDRPLVPLTSPEAVSPCTVAIADETIKPELPFITPPDVSPATVLTPPPIIRPDEPPINPEAVRLTVVVVPETASPEPMVAIAPDTASPLFPVMIPVVVMAAIDVVPAEISSPEVPSMRELEKIPATVVTPP